jgi:pimeloyl-ACP methyl ester carboxylesterase
MPNRLFMLLSAAALWAGCAGNNEKKENQHTTFVYTQTGEGNITLVFVHGWRINKEYWANQLAYFKNKYRVIALDLPGHGQTPPGSAPPTIEEFARMVESVISDAKVDSVILIGHSMSGNINLHVYDKIPQKIIGFIGIDNLQELGHESTPGEAAQTRQFFDTLRKDYKNVAAGFSAGYLFHAQTDSAVKKRVMNDVLAGNPEPSVSILESLSQQYKSEQEIIPKMKIPLLLLAAKGSIKTDSSFKKYCSAGYKYWTFSNAGHYPMIEQPETFNKLLEEAIHYALKK